MHEHTCRQLVAIVGMSVKKAKDQDSGRTLEDSPERVLRVKILCEALWTINNLVAEDKYELDE